MRFSYFLLVSLVFATITADAQIGYGPEIGLNISDYTEKANTYNPSTQTYSEKKINNNVKYGGLFGGILEIELSDHFFLLPALYYFRNGYVEPFPNGTKTVAINTFEIPLNIEYKFGPPRKVKFFVGAGPYVDYNQRGTVIVSSYPIYSTYSLNVGNGANDDIRRIDVGMGVWGVYQITRGLFFRARYQHGFLNMLPQGDDNNSLRNYSVSLSVGYVFPGDLRAKQEPEMQEQKDKK